MGLYDIGHGGGERIIQYGVKKKKEKSIWDCMEYDIGNGGGERPYYLKQVIIFFHSIVTLLMLILIFT